MFGGMDDAPPHLDHHRIRELLAAGQPLNWVATGGSITHGLVHTQGERSYVEHLHEIVRGELGRVRDVIVNTAISGSRTTDVLADWQRRVAAWSPDIVLLLIGTNDMALDGREPVTPEEFAASLRTAISRTRDLGAILVLQTPTPIDVPNAPTHARVQAFATAMREVAAEAEVILVDQLASLTARGEGDIPWGLMADPIHPNATGQAAIMIELARALGIRPSPEHSRTLPLLEARVSAARRYR